MIEAQLEALAADTRRQIYSMLLERPRSVQEFADELPVSRPAVSQHLKVLVDSGLARVQPSGTRRVYSADPAGVGALRDWADELWSFALRRFEDFTNSREKERTVFTEQAIEPVVKTLRLDIPAAEAFEVFTTSLNSWWPLPTHSIAGDDAVSAKMEPFEGGRLFETTSSGEEQEWGQITEWRPGRRVAFTWYPGSPSEQATSVEVRFRDTAEGSEMILIHTGWEARGERAPVIRESYVTGWDIVLGAFERSVPA